MEIEYLHEFTVIANLGSFSRAAEELCISQSALSKHIAALERELDTPLLTRNSRNVSLSPAGAQILPMAAEIFSLGNRIRVAAAKESRKDRHILTIASIPVMAQYNITGVLAKFQQQFPQITLDVAECEQHDLYAMLRDGRCELVFTRRAGSGEPDMEYLPFAQDHLVAVMHETHPLANSAQLRLQDLKDQPLLCLDQRTGLYNLCTSLCLQAGFQPDFVYTGHRPENIVGLAAQNMGVALLMQRHTDYVHLQDVVTIDISPRVESTICLVRQKGVRPSRMGQSFWDFVKALAAQER